LNIQSQQLNLKQKERFKHLVNKNPISSYWYYADINEVVDILRTSSKKVQICFAKSNECNNNVNNKFSKINDLYTDLFIINRDKNEVAPFTIDNFHLLLTTSWKDNIVSICDSDELKERTMLIDVQDDFVVM
jgi:hypothetical protein